MVIWLYKVIYDIYIILYMIFWLWLSPFTSWLSQNAKLLSSPKKLHLNFSSFLCHFLPLFFTWIFHFSSSNFPRSPTKPNIAIAALSQASSFIFHSFPCISNTFFFFLVLDISMNTEGISKG